MGFFEFQSELQLDLCTSLFVLKDLHHSYQSFEEKKGNSILLALEFNLMDVLPLALRSSAYSCSPQEMCIG